MAAMIRKIRVSDLKHFMIYSRIPMLNEIHSILATPMKTTLPGPFLKSSKYFVNSSLSSIKSTNYAKSSSVVSVAGSLPPCLRIYDRKKQWRSDQHNRSSWSFPFILLSASFFSFFGLKQEDEEEPVDPMIMSLKRAKLAEHKEDFSKAEGHYHHALEILIQRELHQEWDESRVLEAKIYIYDNMANLALATGQLNNAQLLFQETMRGLLQKGIGKDHNAIVEISLKLAMIFAMQQKTEDAEQGYQFCIETQEKKLQNGAGEDIDDDTLGLLGMCINSYSRFLIVHNKLDQAMHSLTRTLDIALQVLGDDHPQVAVLYSDLATVASMKGDLDSAKRNMSKAVTLAEKAASPDLPILYCNLGLICLDQGDYSEAKRCCNEAKLFAKKLKDNDAEHEAELCIKEAKEKQKQ